MKLNEYMNTEEYKEASLIQYINTEGEEIEAEESDKLCSPQESANFLLQRLRYNLNDDVKIEVVSATDNR